LADVIERTLDKSDFQIYPDVDLQVIRWGSPVRTSHKCRGSCEP